jgi:sigma-B regulation protein RsbU (phosphoserine phosphatase)
VETQDSQNSDSSLYKENLHLRLAVEELSILNDISTSITSTQSIQQIVDLIIKKCVKHLKVEQGAVLLLEEKDKVHPFHTMVREQDSLYNFLPYRLDSQLAGWILKNKSPLLVNNLRNDDRFKSLIEKDSPIQSILCVPLVVKGNIIGMLNVFNKHTNEGFTSDDQRLLCIIATQSAQIIENARLYEEEQDLIKIKEEMRIAKKIQFNLLPKIIPSIQGYDLAGTTQPAAEVGGDYFDFISIDETKIAFCLGDISGKGIPAAILMSSLQASIRSQAKINNTVTDTVSFVNKLLHENTDPERFATLLYGMLDAKNNRLTYCSAGHNDAFLISGNKEVNRLNKGGLILGMFPEIVYEQESVVLIEGDTFLLYSDGITEAMNEKEEEFGEEQLLDVVKSNLNLDAERLIEEVKQNIDNHSGEYPQFDDITLLVIKRIE